MRSRRNITATSGGPTGEGSGIADGSAIWDHYGPGRGVIRDVISTKDLLIAGTIEPGQSRPGFARERFIRLTQTSSESLQLGSTAYDPVSAALVL